MNLEEEKPIITLCPNIYDSFGGFRGDETISFHNRTLQSLDIDIKTEIKDNDYTEGLQTPYKLFTVIRITHEFLSFLWCVSFWLFIVYEDIQDQIQDGSWKGKVRQSEIVKTAEKLLFYAVSLKEKYSSWDKTLPAPNRFKPEEKRWVGAVNKIFLDAITWILFHEYSHILQDHPSTNINDIKKLEREADNKARELMIASDDDDEYKLHTGIGLVIAHIAMLIVLKDPKHIKQKDHDDIDTRLFNLLNCIDIKTAKDDFYLRHLASNGLEMFCNKWNITIDKSKKYRNVQELLNAYSKRLEEYKNSI